MKKWHYMTMLSLIVYFICIPVLSYRLGQQRGFAIGFRSGREYIPSIREIQKKIGCVKIDGIIGAETLRKWDDAYCEQEWLKEADKYVAKDGLLE